MTRQRAFKRRIRQHMRDRSIGYAAARAELIASAAHRKASRMSEHVKGSPPVAEETIPFLRVTDAHAAVVWYRRLGFVQEWEHRFGPGFPVTVSIARGGRPGTRMMLSEHTGDGVPESLVYLRVEEIESVAAEFDADIHDNGWAREVWLTDPDGNRLRVGAPTPQNEPQQEFTYGEVEARPD